MAPYFIKNNASLTTRTRATTVLCLCIVTLFSTHTQAGNDDNEKSAPSISFLEDLDRHRDSASRNVTHFANWLDNFFGDDRMFDDTQNTRLKLNLLQTFEEGKEPRPAANVQGNLALPNTQKRFNILFESNPDNSIEPANTIVEAAENREQAIALRYTQYASDWLLANTDAGVRARSGTLDSFVRIRLRGLFTTGKWQLRASETLFWRDSTGPGATTELGIERQLATSFLLRSTGKATWLDETREFEINQDFSLLHTINKYHGLIYRIGFTAVSEPVTDITRYIVSVKYRQLIHRDWLYFEVNPEVIYPQEEEFHSRHSLTLKLEILFGAT